GQTRSENLKHAFAMQAQRRGMDLQFLEGKRSRTIQWPLPAITQPTDLVPLIDRWEALPEPDRPTAFVVGADSIAVQLYSALQQRGLQVGKDVSVLSFNHEKPLVIGLNPSLTTIDIRAESMGKRAVDQLRWRMDHLDDDTPTKVLIAPRLIEGTSVAILTPSP
ncbi:MAG: substrate-binding domain-containing protein, partial [Verrucomicrobiae bacterium]|nr:substrate-binding domain-containing protein [Verrucomicrobiae bacterium]